MIPRRISRFVAVLLSILAVLAIAGPAVAAIRIDKIRYDPPGKDTTRNAQLNGEFVMLRNTGDTRRDIGGWRVRDVTGYVYRVPDGFSLRAGAVVRIHTGTGSNDGNDLFWRRGWYVWNNDTDRATLKNRAGDVKDRCRYNDGSTAQNGVTAHC